MTNSIKKIYYLFALLTACANNSATTTEKIQAYHTKSNEIKTTVVQASSPSLNSDQKVTINLGAQNLTEQNQDNNSNIPDTTAVSDTDTDLASSAVASTADTNEDIAIDPEPADLEPSFWQLVISDFNLDHHANLKRVQQQIKWYKKYPDYLPRVISRAEPFLFLIRHEIKQKNLPAELLLLPIVESAYDTYAFSQGGAAGLWQMMPTIGRRLGLTQNWWYDGRRDIIDSTQAALDFLEYLGNKYDNNWLIAIAAYNTGEGNVNRAIRKNKRRGKPTDFWSLDLSRETKEYVPRLLALAHYVKNIVNGIEDQDLIPDIANEPVLQPVAMHKQIDLSLVANLTDLSLRDIYNLNPGYNHWATLPDKSHHILLPLEQAQILKEKLATYPKNKYVQWQRYIIKSGDTLSAIAHKFKTPITTIISANNIRNHTIVAGKPLIIPKASMLANTQATDKRSTLARPKGVRDKVHKVKRGETLWDISRIYRTTITKIAKWNKISIHKPLKIGQILHIWHKYPRHAASPQYEIRPEIIRKINYPVRRGDSIFSIANKFKVNVGEIKEWNQINHNLTPGQRLTLYVNVTELFANV